MNETTSNQEHSAQTEKAMPEDHQLAHMESLREDARDEVKRRIQQRDQYSMQLTVALGAIAVGAFSAKGTHMLFLVAPLVSIYFTSLILFSYRIHDVLTTYLRDEIEPEFVALSKFPTAKEWETWYQNSGLKVGVRRAFFVVQMWMVTVISLGYVWYKECGETRFRCVLIGAVVSYLVLGLWTSLLLRKVKKN
jgi:hypothetical protein